jgi:hypothetical protein
VRIADDMFRVFISHKHEDDALAAEVKTAMESLNPKLIDCFVSRGIPESARVMVGPNDTSGYTLSLFDLAGGEPAKRTWGDLLRAVDGTEAAWRRELDSRFLLALDEQLFPPIEARMRAGVTSRDQKRVYRPILYSIVRGPTVGPVSDAAETDRRPRSVTIVLDPEPLAPHETGNG